MSLNAQEAAAVQDVAVTLEGQLGLTPDGKAYVDKFARFLLNVDRMSADRAAKVKRPRCSFPITVGRWLRRETHRELAARIKNDGRELRTPDGVMVTNTNQPANNGLDI